MRESLIRLLRRIVQGSACLHTARSISVAVVVAAIGVGITKTWSTRLDMPEAEQEPEREAEASSETQKPSTQPAATDSSSHQINNPSKSCFDGASSACVAETSSVSGSNGNPPDEPLLLPSSHLVSLESRSSIHSNYSGMLISALHHTDRRAATHNVVSVLVPHSSQM